MSTFQGNKGHDGALEIQSASSEISIGVPMNVVAL
jgi:hypothetical protein